MTVHHLIARRSWPSSWLVRMWLHGRVGPAAALLFLALSAASCSSEDPAGNPIKPVLVTGTVPISVTIAGSQINNTTLQLAATANFSNGTSRNVSTEASWRTSNPAVVTVTATGLAVAVGNGQANITATFEGVVGTFPVTVQGLAAS